jgi:polyisoprenoid-binding protein YceI
MSTTTATTRRADGQELPAAGTYHLDPTHSHVGFAVRHLGVSKVRGQFGEVEATVEIGDDPSSSSVAVTIAAASVDTGEDQRDGHLRSGDFFDVETHPTIDFRSTGVTAVDDDGRFVVDGELTIKGETRPVPLQATFDGALVDPWGNARFGYSATAEIDREDFGLTWNQVLETGGLLVGKKIRIEIEGEAVRAAD